ncbi:MAG: mannose-1-phosphate guanylyltransferase [Pirellulaceae bacterium]|nr:mannose-1-phosphate guanylyltransferase [Pirellulaceae bacterium]
MLHAVIMAGGAGTRFWPASRRRRPKQLLDLAGGQSMIQATVARLGRLVPSENVLVVTNQQLVDPIRHQLPQLPPAAVLGEPCKRDTAPCVGVAAVWVQQHDSDAIMVVMPADHIIEPNQAFQDAIRYAGNLVEEQPDRIVTFGIRPAYAAESFGYIHRGDAIEAKKANAPKLFQVNDFREKPTAEVAQEYLDDGNYYWNSGIFVWNARTILAQLKQHEPQMFQRIEAIGQAIGSAQFDEVFEAEFSAIVGKSIDYAVMERAENVVVIEAPFDWDDVGSWQALARLRGTDQDGNTIAARHLGIDTQGSTVRGEDEHLVVTVGLKDCLIVHTKDATLVANKHDEERVRDVVKQLEANGWTEFL